MPNSRLEVLGSSGQFSINKLTSDDSSSKIVANKVQEDQLSYDESYSYASHDSSSRFKKNRLGSPYSLCESSMDSAVLMRQIQSQQMFNSQSQSVYS